MSGRGLNAFSSAVEMLRAVRAREISATELLGLHLRRIQRLDPALNAIVVQDFTRARRQAADAAAESLHGGEATLLGLPVTVKESIDVEGCPTTAGVAGREGHRAAFDAASVSRLRSAGAVVLGKTNVCPWLADFTADNPVYGRTNNPWDPARTPGGSSGGSAALAAGLCALDLGSDLGGSVRIPAAFCGLYGHKPSEDIIPNTGHFPGFMLPNKAAAMAAQGPMARSADDLELALSVLAGPDVGHYVGWRLVLPPPRRARLADFRVAILPLQGWLRVDPETLGALDQVTADLSRLGATVREIQPPGLGSGDSLRDYYRLFRSMMSVMTTARWAPEVREAKAAEKMARGEEFQAADARGMRASAGDYLLWHEHREGYRSAYRAFFQEWDVLLTPASLVPAPRHEELTGSTADRRLRVAGLEQEFDYMSFYPSVATLCGQPATVFPGGLNEAGLPLGLQAVGPYLEDLTTIRFAGLLEREFGGFRPPPGYDADFL